MIRLEWSSFWSEDDNEQSNCSFYWHIYCIWRILGQFMDIGASFLLVVSCENWRFRVRLYFLSRWAPGVYTFKTRRFVWFISIRILTLVRGLKYALPNFLPQPKGSMWIDNLLIRSFDIDFKYFDPRMASDRIQGNIIRRLRSINLLFTRYTRDL